MLEPHRIFHTRKIYVVEGSAVKKTNQFAKNLAQRIQDESGLQMGATHPGLEKAFCLSDFKKEGPEQFWKTIEAELHSNDETPLVVSNPGRNREVLARLEQYADEHGISVEKIKAKSFEHAQQSARQIVQQTSVRPLQAEEIQSVFDEAKLEGLPDRALHHVLRFMHDRFNITSSSFMMRQRPLEHELRERLETTKARMYNTAYFHSIIEDKPGHLKPDEHRAMLDGQRRVEVDLTEGPDSRRLTARVITRHAPEETDEDGHYYHPRYDLTQHSPEIDRRLGKVRSVFMAPLFEIPDTERRKLMTKHVPHGNMALFRMDTTRHLPQSVIKEIKKVLLFVPESEQGKQKETPRGKKQDKTPPEEEKSKVSPKLDEMLREMWKDSIINLDQHESQIAEIHDLEQEDEYTAGHTLRVASLNRLFGRYAYRELERMRQRRVRQWTRKGRDSKQMKPEDYLDRHARRFLQRWAGKDPHGLFDRRGIIRMYYAGLLHDVGKRRKGIPGHVQVPLEVLQKPGQLHYGEYSQMKRHPLAAAYALKDLPLDDPLLLAAMQHHANWDGKGSYPAWYNPKTRRLVNLRGDMIHPYAQFVALADVFDALVSRRPYRKRVGTGQYLDQYSAERTAREILSMRGKFSPFVRRVFRRILADAQGMQHIERIYRDSQMAPGLILKEEDETIHSKPGPQMPDVQLSPEDRRRIQEEERQLLKRVWPELHQMKKTAAIAA